MFETLFAKLAGMKIFAKIAIVAVVVALIFGVTMCAVGGKDVLPENQDPQNEQQQELQPEEEPEDDIIDIEDVEDAEDSENTENTEDADADNNGIKDFISDIIDAITGGDKKDDESKNKEEAKNPVSSGRLQRFIVSFETNGGGKIGDKSVIINTKISKLPTPNREGYIFLGWCYDEALTDFVKAEDGVTKNLTLYAAYLEESPIESLETVHFAAAENVGKDFTIKVLSSDKNMTAEDVKAALRTKNLTNPAVTDFIEVTETEDGFIISGVQHSEGMGTSKGFEEGATYSIELNSDALSFADYPESAREFNFTTYKEEVLNFKLNKDIVFIPAKDLRNIINNGEKVETLDIALYNIGKDGGVSVASLTKGTFDYDKELKVGQIVSVYEGLIPTERTLDTPDELLGDIGYVEITAKNGNRYSYKNADPEDIIFTPDMLPVPVDADKDSTPEPSPLTKNISTFPQTFISQSTLTARPRLKSAISFCSIPVTLLLPKAKTLQKESASPKSQKLTITATEPSPLHIRM